MYIKAELRVKTYVLEAAVCIGKDYYVRRLFI
jgi:hypothetical protein